MQTLKRFLINIVSKQTHTQSSEKSAIVERFNRAINSKTTVKFKIHQNYRWIDILQQVTGEYNDKKHRTIKTKRAEVNKFSDKNILESIYRRDNLLLQQYFKTGDRIKTSTLKKTLETNILITGLEKDSLLIYLYLQIHRHTR